jgi:hypothetical protein
MLKSTWTDLGGDIVWWTWLDLSLTGEFKGNVHGLGHRMQWLPELGDENSYYDEGSAVLEF